MGLGGLALSWLWSFLKDYVQRVQLVHDLLAPWTLNCGVPQGSSISPMLFSIYVKPLEEGIRRSGVRYHQYGDDMQLYFSFSTSAVDAIQTLKHCLG